MSQLSNPIISEGMSEFVINIIMRDRLLNAGLICASQSDDPEARPEVYMLTTRALDMYDPDDPEAAALAMLKGDTIAAAMNNIV